MQFVTLLCLALGRLAAEEIPPAPDYAEIGRNQKALVKYDVFTFKYKVPKDIQDAFYRGDYSLLDKLAAEKNLKELFNLLSATVPVSFGQHIFQPVPLRGPSRDPDYYKPNLEFGARVGEQIKERLAAIPGHTEMLVQGIEAASNLKGGHGMRLGNIAFLGRIGSMEAIQQLGRYLSDDRNLEGYYFYGGPDSGMNPPVENSHEATVALRHALGDASPVPRVRSGVIEGFAGGETVEKMRSWWQSEAGRPYREWKYEDDEPMPPPRKRPVSLRTPSQQDPTTQPPSAPPNELRSTSIWPVILILAFAAIAAALGFSKLRRG